MAGDAELLRAFDLVPCLNSLEQAARHLAELPTHPTALQIDSGMNRLGLEPAEIERLQPDFARLAPRLVISHLACADEPGHQMNAAQRAAFMAMRTLLPGVRWSLAATGGILLGPDFHFDLTRPGVGLYGGLPFTGARAVVTLSLPVVQVRDVAPGETVGYGAAWTATRPSRIATLAAGYADGLIRRIGESDATVFAGATSCPLVGRISMDLAAADVTDLPVVPDGLEILGHHQSVDALAKAAGTIGYEILTALGGRYERHYTHGPAGSLAT
jgi:alanine racemase